MFVITLGSHLKILMIHLFPAICHLPPATCHPSPATRYSPPVARAKVLPFKTCEKMSFQHVNCAVWQPALRTRKVLGTWISKLDWILVLCKTLLFTRCYSFCTKILWLSFRSARVCFLSTFHIRSKCTVFLRALCNWQVSDTL